MERFNEIGTLLNIRPGEGQAMTLLLAHSFFVGGTLMIFFTGASAMFLGEFSTSVLPYIYIALAIVNTSVGFTQSKIEERVSAPKFLIGTLIFLIVLVGIYRASIDVQWVVFGSLILYFLVDTLLKVEFWSLPPRLFNVQQGKRLFSVIVSGDIAARIIAGFITIPIVNLVGTANLMVVVIGGLIFCLVFLLLVLRAFPDKFPDVREETDANEADTSSINLLTNRYVGLIFVLFLLSISGNYFIDFVFFNQAETRFISEDDFARFFGLFYGIVMFVIFFTTSFLSGRFISRFGIQLGLLSLPIVLTTGIALTAITGTVIGLGAIFWLVIVTKAGEDISRLSFEQPSLRVLYVPLPSQQRLAAQVAVEGRGAPLGAGLAGTVLLLFTLYSITNVIYLVYFMLTVFMVWIFVVILVYREYLVVLKRSLLKRDLSTIELSFIDNASEAVFMDALNSPSPNVVAYALDKLEEVSPQSLPVACEELLDHPTPAIRQNVLTRIEKHGYVSTLPAIRKRITTENSDAVRGAALQTLAALTERGLIGDIYPYLDDANPIIQRGALVGLLRNGEIEAVVAAGEKLTRLIHSNDPDERVFAAQVIGESAVGGFYRSIIGLINDEDIHVKKAALSTVGKTRVAKVWPVVIENLAQPEVRRVAAAALIRGGESVLPYLDAEFLGNGHDRDSLKQLSWICGRIGGIQAIQILKQSIDVPDVEVRTQVLADLCRSQYQANDEEKPKIEQQIKEEVTQAVWVQAVYEDLGNSESLSMLRMALINSLRQFRERIFLWLSFIYEPQIVQRVWEVLDQATDDTMPEKRAYALEVINVLMSPELRSIVMPLLEELPHEQQQETIGSVSFQQSVAPHQRLGEIITASERWVNSWTKACAIHAAAQLSAKDLVPDVATAVDSPHGLVRETALWALFKLDETLYAQYAAKLSQDRCPQIACLVEQLNTMQTRDISMLSTLEKIMTLKGIELFARTPEDVLTELAGAMEELRVEANQTLFSEGNRGDALYIVIDGQIRIHSGEHVIAILEQGEVVGELSVLDPAPRLASATVINDARLFRISAETFNELMADRPEIAEGIIQVLVGRLRATTTRQF